MSFRRGSCPPRASQRLDPLRSGVLRCRRRGAAAARRGAARPGPPELSPPGLRRHRRARPPGVEPRLAGAPELRGASAGGRPAVSAGRARRRAGSPAARRPERAVSAGAPARGSSGPSGRTRRGGTGREAPVAGCRAAVGARRARGRPCPRVLAAGSGAGRASTAERARR